MAASPCSGPGCSFVPPVSCSPLGRHHDTIHFRQLLCPDPSCEVCNSTTAEINRLLFLQTLEDSTSLASTAPVTSSSFTLSTDFSAVPPGELIPASLPESSPPPASIFSPNPVIPVANFFPPSPPGDSLPPEPFPPLDSKFPIDHFPAQPPAFPPPVPPHHAHSVDRSVQTETVSLNTLSQDVSPLPELSQRVNPTETFARHHAPPNQSASPPPDCNLSVTRSKPISKLRKGVQESSPPQSSGRLSTCITASRGMDPSSLSILDLPPWQTHAKGFFPSTLAPRDFHQALPSSEASSRGDPVANLVEPGNLSLLSPDALALLEKQVQNRSDFLRGKETRRSFPNQTDAFWSSKGQCKELPMQQQRPYPTTLEKGHLQQTPIQFFWGLQTPHRESFFPAADASDNISNASPEQESPGVPHPLPPSLPENPPQLLPQTQPLPISHVQPQAHLQSPLPIRPSGPLADISICGVCFHRPHNESDSLTSREIQHLEWNVLQKVQKRVWGLPTIVQRSQEDYGSSASNPCFSHKATKAPVVSSVTPGQFPLNEELRRKLEHHLHKRLILHQRGLPRRIYDSVALTLPQLPESQRHGGRSGISNSPIRRSMTKSVYVELPEFILQDSSCKDDLEKDQGHNPENNMGYGSEQKQRSQSVKSSMVSVDTTGQRQLENAVKTVHNSWLSVEQTPLVSEKSQNETKQESLPPSQGEDDSLNTFQELPLVTPTAAQTLEDHIKRLNKRVTWGLPPRVLESIQCFKSKESTYSVASLKSLRGHKAGTANSAPIPDHPLPATSTVGREEQRILRPPATNITHQTPTSVKRDSIGNRWPPSPPRRQGAFRRPQKLPIRQGVLRWEPKVKSANADAGRGQEQGIKGKNTESGGVPTE
ncbi:spermatogenesis-associated protein 31D1-like [Neovison vison]|uniref:spermatogenesis-associated protein 31D1-like n=1 Tax=Neovison vison TaxID=452646 RepID=UPI001CF07524|nr:spermatogenesis-associated protein 31D1-like [Neogale vison]